MSKRTNRSLKRIIANISLHKLKEISIAFRVFQNPVPQILLYLGITRFSSPYIVNLRNGYKIQIDSPDDLVSVWGCWIRQDYPVYGDEKVIIDAGANIGAFSLFAASKSRNAQILAIEPVTNTFEKLNQNIRASTSDKRINCAKYGIASNSGEQTIYLGSAGTYSSFYENQTNQTEIVITKTLHQVFQEIGNDQEIDLLKMDCEGAEMDSLLGAAASTLGRCKRIVMEYHTFAGFNINDVTQHLGDAGFSNTKLEHFQGLNCGLAYYVRNLL